MNSKDKLFLKIITLGILLRIFVTDSVYEVLVLCLLTLIFWEVRSSKQIRKEDKK